MGATKRIREVRKRDSRIVPFDETKITDAIYAAIRSVGEGDRALAAELAAAVTHFLEEKFAGSIPGIEDIQDLVETVLIEMGHARVAKAYILYRQKRATLRGTLEVRKVPSITGEGVSFDYSSDCGGRRKTHGLDSASLDPAGGSSLPAASLGGGPSGDDHGEHDPFPEVDQGHGGVSSWQKSKIAAALIREADLDPGVAAEIASNVERKVLASAWKRISASLIRELVDNELFERGFSAKLEKQAPIGLPKYNLEQIIFGTDLKEGYAFPKTPTEIRNIIANRILHQYSLQEVFTPEVSEAHRDGRIFIHRLSDPIRLARMSWRLAEPGALGRRRDGRDGHLDGGYLDWGDFFRRLWHFAHFFSEEIRLGNLPNLLLDPGSRSLSTGEKVRAVLARLSQMDERPDISLELDLTPDALPWLEGLRELSPVRPRRFLLSLRARRELFLSPEGEAILSLVGDLYERNERIEFLPCELMRARRDAFGPSHLGAGPGRGRSPVGRGAREFVEGNAEGETGSEGFGDEGIGLEGSGVEGSGLVASAAKITINLPRAAFRSARDGRSSIETACEDVLDLAIKGHLERRRFLERLGSNRENPLWDLLGKLGEAPLVSLDHAKFTVGILGLNECVKFLTGNDLHQDARSSKLGLEIVRGIHRKLQREEKSLGIRLQLEETANVGPLRVLERADRRRYPQMAEIDRGRSSQWGSLYTDGVRLHRMAPVDPLRRVEELAPYLRLLAPSGGFVEDFPELRGSAKELLLTLLEECVAR